ALPILLGVGTAPPRAPGCGARGGGRTGRAAGCTGGRRGAGPRGTGSRRAGWSGSLLDLVGELDVHVPGVRAFADLDGLAVLVGPPGQPALHGGAGPGEAVLLEPLVDAGGAGAVGAGLPQQLQSLAAGGGGLRLVGGRAGHERQHVARGEASAGLARAVEDLLQRLA